MLKLEKFSKSSRVWKQLIEDRTLAVFVVNKTKYGTRKIGEKGPPLIYYLPYILRTVNYRKTPRRSQV